jgi:hypothetical protein
MKRGVQVSKQDRLGQAEQSEKASSRLRARLGLGEGNPEEMQVRDWMLSRGAVPVSLACVALALYLVVSVVARIL